MAKLLKEAKNTHMLPAHPVNMHDEVNEWLPDLEFCKTDWHLMLSFVSSQTTYTMKTPLHHDAILR